jgi:hypothetical protein
MGCASNCPSRRIWPRLDIGRPERAVIEILQRHRHDLGTAVDIDAAEKTAA